MIADHFAKPLQGLLFEKFRDIVMGITHCSSLVAPASINARSVLDGDISEDSPRPIQARLAHDSKDKASRSPLTKSVPKTMEPNTAKRAASWASIAREEHTS
jgi:hypothetical protein